MHITALQADANVVNDAALLRKVAARRRREKVRRIFDRLFLVVLLLGTWEAIVRIGWADAFFVGEPSSIAVDLWHLMTSGELWPNLRITLEEALTGLVIGTALGMAMGFLAGVSRRISDAVQPLMVAFHSMPVVAIAPLFIIWFGFGSQSKIALSSLVVFFVTFFNTYSGVQSVDEVLINSIKSMGGSRWTVLRMVQLPVSLAWVFAALKTSISSALVASVVGEFVGSTGGIGWMLSQASGTLDTTRVFSAMIVLAIVGGALFILVTRLERQVLRWRRTSVKS